MSVDCHLEKLIISKHFYSSLTMLLYNIELPGSLILKLLRCEDLFINIFENAELFYKSNFENDNKSQLELKNFKTSYDKMKLILEKFRKKIDSEGADIKFSQNIEVSIIYVYVNYLLLTSLS